jgi:hypothetical protein
MEPENKFRTVIDFMDMAMRVVDDEGNDVYIESPLKNPLSLTSAGDPSLVLAMQSLSVYEGISVPGRINIRQAPRAVLSAIPGIGDNDELLEDIISRRVYDLDDPDFFDRNRKYATFLLVESFLGIEPSAAKAQMQQLLPYINSGGSVYRAEAVGYFGDGRGTSRAEAIFDNTTGVPQILMWRNKSHLQTGYSIEALGSELQAIGSQLER